MENQNSPENIQLLRAMRNLYSRAKTSFNFRLILALLIGIVPPILTNNEELVKQYPNAPIYFAMAGILFSIFVFLIKEWEKGVIEIAAKVQEEFDINLFQLDWNQILVGNKIPREAVIKNSNSFSGNEEKLKNWYSIKENYTESKNIMLCQRENLYWDSSLKKRFAIASTVLAILFLLSGLFFCLLGDDKTTLIDYLTKYLATSLPAILIFSELAVSHFSMANNQLKREEEIRNLIEGNSNYSLSDLRKVQDYIFSNRKNSAVVPNWFYFWFRKNDQAVSTQATEMLNK